jgi:hypothetical protein
VEENQKPDSLSDEFNRLSRWDRTKLHIAAVFTAVSGVARDDTIKHPWRFPLYAGYMAVLGTAAALSMIPGTTELIIALTIGAISLKPTDWSRWVCGRVKETFNSAAMVERHPEFMRQDAEGNLKVKGVLPLTGKVIGEMATDMGQATWAAWLGLRRALHI